MSEAILNLSCYKFAPLDDLETHRQVVAAACRDQEVKGTVLLAPEGINFFTRTKVVTTRWPDPRTSRVDLGFPQNR